MPSYISNTRPTVFQIVLSQLGIIELPVKVNCWYCSQDSFLIPGTKNTSRHWLCHLCENVNVRDSAGEIVDPSTFETARQSGTPITPRSQSTVGSYQRTLCEDCQQNQTFIYQQLSEYIPDESDPQFNYRYENADNYKADLHKRYPLCKGCQKLVNDLASEQQDLLQRRTLLEVADRSKKAIIPKRPSKRIHIIKGMLWSLIHFVTLVYLLRFIIYPPSVVEVTAVHYRKLVDIVQYTINSVRSDSFDTISLVELVKDLVLQFIISLFKSSKAVFTCLLTNDLTCQDQSIELDTVILLNMSSLLFFNWHHIIRTIYGDMDRLKNWNLYLKIQWLLFFARFLSAALVAHQVSVTILMFSLVLYILVLFLSIIIVKRKHGIWNLSSVGKQGSLASNDDQQQFNSHQDTMSFSVLENEDNMSIVDEPMNSDNIDHIDHIVSDFNTFHINHNRL